MDSANRSVQLAPGAPGIPARWTSSAKIGVGTALSNDSHVWFTLSHGIFNEIYYPRIDQACVRDMGLIVTDGAGYFSEEKRDAACSVGWLADGVPAFELGNASRDGRYRIEKRIVTDPQRDTVLQEVRFVARQGTLADYHLHVLLAPHLGNQGGGNTAWVEDFESIPLLFARRDGNALALGCSVAWKRRSVGYVGVSDGWQDLKAHQRLRWEYQRADNGNVAMTGEIDLLASQGEFLLALGFGCDPQGAARNVIASLREGFAAAREQYIRGWQTWIRTHTSPARQPAGAARSLSDVSLAVLRTHESKTEPGGGLIASLAIPWGFSKGDNDLGGYHLIWPRDMVQTAGALLAAGAHEDARRVLHYLQKTQRPDGHWPQNMWLDGSPYWDGIQMDETALPILLVDLARREKALTVADTMGYWPMVRQAAGYVVRNGPVSPQDRWEEDPGYSPFTVGAEIAALLAAADLADVMRESSVAAYLRETADAWHGSIDRWIYASGTDWCNRFDVKGYYVRIAPSATGSAHLQKRVQVKNVAADEDSLRACHLVSPDALALVRFGLRAADDPRMRDTAKVIDALLKIDTPAGPTWHRYNDDGYGEHEDGAPFDGTGIGRGWPLLTGERSHYELALGRRDEAMRLLNALESFANEGGLLPEQVWDSADIPQRELFKGRASGSAMPLVWAHAEYLKLRRSLRDGRLFDQPRQTVQRYLVDKTLCSRLLWRFNHKIRSIPPGTILRIETLAPASVHWSADDWNHVQDLATHAVEFGLHVADLPVQSLAEGAKIRFTFYWPEADRWEGTDFLVRVGPLQPQAQPRHGATRFPE